MEWYLRKGLISKSEWEGRITQLRTAEHGIQHDLLAKRWLHAFERAVLDRATGDVGVLFSGGVDSTFIAYVLHKHQIPFTCYTVGFHDEGTKEPEDVVEAKRVAEHFGWQHKCQVLNLEELEPILRETAQVLGDAANPVTVGVGAVVVAAGKLAKKDGISTLFGGLGSEEIFAGYERHEKASDVQEECWNGLYRMYERDLIRDTRIGAALGLSVPTPFLDWGVLVLGMQLPSEQKIVDGHKKYILRAIAEEYGLPHAFAFRPKRAAQYGSRIDSALDKLAKRKGVSKKEYASSL